MFSLQTIKKTQILGAIKGPRSRIIPQNLSKPGKASKNVVRATDSKLGVD
jgi:hypothetical protein